MLALRETAANRSPNRLELLSQHTHGFQPDGAEQEAVVMINKWLSKDPTLLSLPTLATKFVPFIAEVTGLSYNDAKKYMAKFITKFDRNQPLYPCTLGREPPDGGYSICRGGALIVGDDDHKTMIRDVWLSRDLKKHILLSGENRLGVDLRNYAIQAAPVIAQNIQPVAAYHGAREAEADDSKNVYTSTVRMLVTSGWEEADATSEMRLFDQKGVYPIMLGTAKPSDMWDDAYDTTPGINHGKAVVKTATAAQALVARNNGLRRTKTVADGTNLNGRVNMTWVRNRQRTGVANHLRRHGMITKLEFRQIGQKILQRNKATMIEVDVDGEPVSAAEQAEAQFNPIYDQ